MTARQRSSSEVSLTRQVMPRIPPMHLSTAAESKVMMTSFLRHVHGRTLQIPIESRVEIATWKENKKHRMKDACLLRSKLAHRGFTQGNIAMLLPYRTGT